MPEAIRTEGTNEIVKVRDDDDLDCGRIQRGNEEPTYILCICCGIRSHRVHRIIRWMKCVLDIKEDFRAVQPTRKIRLYSKEKEVTTDFFN